MFLRSLQNSTTAVKIYRAQDIIYKNRMVCTSSSIVSDTGPYKY
jgi:hypothetical protein